MKKMFFVLCVFAIAIACTPTTPQQESVAAQDSAHSVEPYFFTVTTDTIKSGDNLWNYSKMKTGDGFNWRDWVMANPILQEPGRIWQDSTGIWYCLLKPGEVLESPYPDTTEIRPTPKPMPIPNDGTPQKPVFTWFDSLPLWALFLLILGITLAIMLIIKRGLHKNTDPVNAGPPQVQGGVRDSGAHGRMGQLIESRYPGAIYRILNIRRGVLNGTGMVHYAEGKPKKLTMKNTPAYAGETLVNGRSETVYFLQGCGNDARIGNFMFGEELIFTPDVFINQDGSETLIPIIVPQPTTPTTEIPEPAPVNLGSEFHQQVTGLIGIVGKFLESNESKHKVTLKITKDGNFEAIVENRFEVSNPKKQVSPAESEKSR